jgi:hypothetical protein
VSEAASEGMTFDQANAAISEAVSNDPAFNPNAPSEPLPQAQPASEAPAPAASDQAAEPTPGEAPAEVATEPFTSADVGEDSFMGEGFNPDLLPEELRPGFAQLQADYTRKTQALAEQRKALEALGDPESLKSAAELYQSLQDPEYLKAFYNELGGVVQELGLVEAPADPSATPAEPVVPEIPELPAELQSLVASDPELTPLAEKFASMEQRLAQFEAAQAQERQALAEERQLMAEAAEIDRMVGVVREEHPDYGEADWQAIYDRAVAYDGNVLEAAARYEADKDRILQSYLSQKSAPHPVTPTGANVVTEPEHEGPTTLAEAQKQAEAYLHANDLEEFTG